MPYGASVPESIDGLLATAKNMGSTHISNGAVRLQPAEMNHGESIGLAAVLSVELGVRPRDLHDEPTLLNHLIMEIVKTGRSLTWFDDLGIYGTEEYYEDIQYVAARGYLSGFRTKDSRLPKFRPSDGVSRRNIAKVIVEWLDWPTEIGAGAPHFDDVSPEDPFYSYVKTLVSRGVELGCGGPNYCPDSLVTRAEATAFLTQSKQADLLNSAAPSFSDVPSFHWAHAYIETAFALGWYRDLWPTEDDLLRPEVHLIRRELAKLLFNIDEVELAVARRTSDSQAIDIRGTLTNG